MKANPRVLRLSLSGDPQEWMSLDDAVTRISKGIAWQLGSIREFRGGYQQSVRSVIDIPAIIAVRGKSVVKKVGGMDSDLVKARDNYTCQYCALELTGKELTIDHIIPRSKGGRDSWMNCVASCKRCNNRKASHLLEDLDMELIAVPFVPSIFEVMYLKNRSGIVADQYEYLSNRFVNVEKDSLRMAA